MLAHVLGHQLENLQLSAQDSARWRVERGLPCRFSVLHWLQRDWLASCIAQPGSPIFPFEFYRHRSLFHFQFLPCVAYQRGAPEADGLWRGVLLIAWFPHVGLLPVTMGHICSPEGLHCRHRHMGKWLKHLKMESPDIFEGELSVALIRCLPDSVRMFSFAIHRQGIVHLSPLLTRGIKGLKKQAESQI